MCVVDVKDASQAKPHSTSLACGCHKVAMRQRLEELLLNVSQILYDARLFY